MKIVMIPETWESDFIEWDNAGHSNASQRDIINWFKERFLPEQESKSALEVLKNNMSENTWEYIANYTVNGRIDNTLIDWIIDAMNEFTAQSHLESKGLTEPDLETTKQQFCSELESILQGVRLKNFKTDEGDQFPLLDLLSSQIDDTISSGKDEINNIVEQIYFRLDELSIFQSHPEAREIPSDDDIDREFPVKSETTTLTNAYINANHNARIGAKWFKSQIKQSK